VIPYGKQRISEDDIGAVVDVLRSDWLTTGPKVEEFERALAGYVGAKHAVAVNSGTSALDIAVASLRLPEGSEIITTPFTFVASSNCILYNRCKPVFADIDPRTYNIDPDQIRKKITDKTKAILYVDYAGQPCDISKIRELADENGLLLIEDACHALGAEYKKKRVGSFADMTVFSFHPVKHITTGEGGAVTTENEDFLNRLKILRNHGIDKMPNERTGYLYDMKALGRNYRITDFQCALGISQLCNIERSLREREETVRRYNEEFRGIDDITTPYTKPEVRHAWHLYTVLLKDRKERDGFYDSMKKIGVGVNVHYIPVYKFSYYKYLGIGPADFPVTERIYSRIVTLPLFYGITEREVEKVVAAVRKSV